MRRRPGTLLPIEASILEAGLGLRREGQPDFHGFAIARTIADGDDRGLTAHGTLYKALGRLEAAGMLTSAWEDAQTAADAGRPRRRLYTVTGAGERAYAGWRQRQRRPMPAPHPGMSGA